MAAAVRREGRLLLKANYTSNWEEWETLLATKVKLSAGRAFHQLPRASEAAEIIHNTVEVVEPYVRRQYLTTQEKEQRRRRG
jgi:hypothetical protein